MLTGRYGLLEMAFEHAADGRHEKTSWQLRVCVPTCRPWLIAKTLTRLPNAMAPSPLNTTICPQIQGSRRHRKGVARMIERLIATDALAKGLPTQRHLALRQRSRA